MCVFVSRPMKIVTFLRKNVTPQNGLLIFLWKETQSETKSWKSSKISTKKLQQQRFTLEIVEDFACEDISGLFFYFFSILHFFNNFSFFLFFISFIFFHFLSIFLHFLSCSFMFFHVLSFSLSLLGAQNLIFFGPQFRYDFS